MIAHLVQYALKSKNSIHDHARTFLKRLPSRVEERGDFRNVAIVGVEFGVLLMANQPCRGLFVIEGAEPRPIRRLPFVRNFEAVV